MGVHELFNHVYFEFCKAHLFNLFLKMIEFRAACLIHIPYLNQIPDLVSSVKLLQIPQLGHILCDPAGKFSIYIKAFLTQFFKPFKVFDDNNDVDNDKFEKKKLFCQIILIKLNNFLKSISSFQTFRLNSLIKIYKY